MFITTKVTWDIDGNVVEREGYEYEGPVAECKGEGTARQQLDQQNQLQQQAFNAQMATLNTLKSSLSGYLSGTQGFTPQALAAMNSQAINQNSAKYNQAGEAVRAALQSRGQGGGQVPVGGSYTSGIASLEGAKASDLANSLNTIQLENSQQALTNQFNAANVLSGNAATLNSPISTFGSGASNSLDQYVKASNSGFGSSLLNGLGSGLGGAIGKGIGSGITGGIGNVLTGWGKQ